MEQFQIETAQNITINQNAAHLGDRMVAFLIDSFIVICYFILSIVLLLSLDIEMNDAWAIYMILNLPAFLYYLLFETLMNGQSIGKKIVQIRVVKLDGTKPTFSSYVIRWVLRIIDVSLSSGGVAVLTILLKGNGQRLGDIAAGTTVISEKKKVTLRDTLLTDLPEDYRPTFSQVTVFNDREIQTIKELYDEAKRKGNHHIILSLSDQIKKVTQISTDLNPIDFVDVIIKDYNYYTQRM